MFLSPKPLRDYCLQYLRELINTSVNCSLNENQINSEIICEKRETIDFNKHLMTINSELSEELIELFSVNNQLTDRVLLMSIFNSDSTQLKRVRISDASLLTTRGLIALNTHHMINDLKVCGLKKCSINQLIQCLSHFSLNNIKVLNISKSLFTTGVEFSTVIDWNKFLSLTKLDVSHTLFNDKALQKIVEVLPCLQCLNISSTRVRDLTPLFRCKDRLKWLSIYNLSFTPHSFQQFVPILMQLNCLQYLDISDDRDINTIENFTQILLKNPQLFKDLISLDISGRIHINSEELQTFIEYKMQNKCKSLQFLGLLKSNVSFEELFIISSIDSELVITGNASEVQILESLHRYEGRPNFVINSLQYLLNSYNFLNLSETRPDIIEMIVFLMRKYSMIIDIQISAFHCLTYNLWLELHPQTIKKVVDVILMLMELHPNHQFLQTQALLILTNILNSKDVSFDWFKCCQLVMDCLVAINVSDVNGLALIICHKLSYNITNAQKSILGSNGVYMQTLLNIIRDDIRLPFNYDNFQKNILSLLYLLSNDSPKTCEMFLEKGGLDLYLNVLKVFTSFISESDVHNIHHWFRVSECLGLLSNIAQISYLRSYLMNSELLSLLRNLLHSSQIFISHNTIAIFAHLLSDGLKNWSCISFDINTVLDEIEKEVLSWKITFELFWYQSLQSFIPLLNCSECPSIQLFSIWSIHCLCSQNPKLYTKMLIEEKVDKTIVNIYQTLHSNSNSSLKKLFEQTLIAIKKEFPKLNY